MPFCRKCGNQVRDDQAFCDKCGTPQPIGAATAQPSSAAPTPSVAPRVNPFAESASTPSPNLFVENVGSDTNLPAVLQYIRGIPFGLVFLAFLLPLFVISCPGIDSNFASFSAYDALDINSSVSVLADKMGGLAGDFSLGKIQDQLFPFAIACTVMFIMTAAAFGFGFINRIVALFCGLIGLILMVVLVAYPYSHSKNDIIAIEPGTGFVIALILFVAGIIMCIIAPRYENPLSPGVKAVIYSGIAIVSIGTSIYALHDFISEKLAKSEVSEIDAYFHEYVRLQNDYVSKNGSLGSWNKIGFSTKSSDAITFYEQKPQEVGWRNKTFTAGLNAKTNKRIGTCDKGSWSVEYKLVRDENFQDHVSYSCSMSSPECAALTPKFLSVCK